AAADQGVRDRRPRRPGQIRARRWPCLGRTHDQRGARGPRASRHVVHGRRRAGAAAGRPHDRVRGRKRKELAGRSRRSEQALDRLIAGEYAIGLEMNNTHAAISAAQGAPVKWVPLNPVSETLQVAGVTKGAQHPNAARLFIDFMTSKAGQEIFRDNDYVPMHPDVAARIPELKPQQGGYQSVVYTPDNLEIETTRWAKIYDDLFR